MNAGHAGAVVGGLVQRDLDVGTFQIGHQIAHAVGALGGRRLGRPLPRAQHADHGADLLQSALGGATHLGDGLLGGRRDRDRPGARRPRPGYSRPTANGP